MSVVRVVAKNTVAQGLSKFISILSSIVLTVLLTRSLSKADFGTYTFITSFTLLFGTIADWGTNIVTVRETSSDPRAGKAVFANSVVVRISLSVFALLLLNLAIRLNPAWQRFSDLTLVTSLVLLALSFKTSVGMVFHSFQKLELSGVVDVFASIFFVSSAYLILESGGGVTGVLWVWFGATALSALVGILLSSEYFNFKNIFSGAVVNAKSLLGFYKSHFLRSALPAGFLFIVSTIYNRVDILILEYFKGTEAVASYGLPYRVYDQVILVSAFLMTSLFPILAKSFSERDTLKLKEYYQRAFDILLVSGILIAVGVAALSSFIVNFLGGSDYSESVQILRILSFAVLPSFINHLTGYSLLAFGKQKLSLAIAVGALVLNIALNLAFVPKYSFIGSASITLITELFVLLVSTIAISKTIKYSPSLFSFPSTLLKINQIYSSKNDG